MISFEKILNTIPKVEYYPEFDSTGEDKGVSLKGIKAIAYEGALYKGKRTKVFAHMAYPESTEKPVPAVVLVHGGGGHPEDKWIKKWTEKGYAAISMDTTGYFPTKPVPYLFEGYAEGLERKLTPPFYEEGFTVGPDNSSMADMELETSDQWMYQAVSSVILAHNILRNDPKIDKDKIGITGISWGGIITSIVIGFDNRFSFAIPIYGSGYLAEGLSDLDKIFANPDTKHWHAENNFHKVTMPVLWLCWNDDCCFSVQSNSLSYLATKGTNKNTRLSMLHNMRHSHRDGYLPEESYIYADSIINNKAIPNIEAEYKEGKILYSCSGEVSALRLFYTDEKMTYIIREKYGDKNCFMKEDWQILNLDPSKSEADLPKNAVGKYLEFTLKNGMILTTPYEENFTD